MYRYIIAFSLFTLSMLLIACQDNPISAPSKNITTEIKATPPLAQYEYSAHWLTLSTLLLPPDYSPETLILRSVMNNQTQTTKLTKVADQTQISKPNYLKNFIAYQVNMDVEAVKKWLKTQLTVINNQNNTVFITGVQTARLLDELYTSNSNDANEEQHLGATFNQKKVTFKLWAPTALSVEVLLFDKQKQAHFPSHLIMNEDTHTGIWQVSSAEVSEGTYYQYQIKVFHPVSGKVEKIITTDPYSLSLSTNSEYSQVVNLKNKNTQPDGWDQQLIPVVEHPEDNIFYETHINDFSAHDNKLSSELSRGKYSAFSETNSSGINYLRTLKQAGINNIHLLPTFDIGTVNESNNQTVKLSTPVKDICQLQPTTTICQQSVDQHLTLAQLLTRLDPNTGDAQAVIEELRNIDDYNWGYDPFHYTVPEGSYAQNPEGIARIIEFRQMVQSIHNLGFRVIMDVVYNHTHQAGLEKTAVLDKIVPNYYQRLDPFTGKIEQSTCCDNTATEHVMMEKLMIDSLVVWARDYKIDGFRFDLMAHQPKSAMLKARQAVKAVDNDTYFYGEGWNFGEIANNAQFVQASQLELGGSEIGTFSDRLRDAVRGGAFTASGNDIRKSQGIGNGLATFDNELVDREQSRALYLLLADQLRVGLAGNLANFPIENAQGLKVTGKEIPYGDQPTGYALDPADTINYVSKHDNQTLWDNNQYRLPFDMSTHNRVRFQLLSLAYPIFAQGIPFLHMGSELLRSKSFLRDSYDYSNWFNKVDFSGQKNNYNVGLPPAEKDQANWPLIQNLLEKNQGRDQVSPQDIHFSKKTFLSFIKVRMSSPLFRLTTAQAIIERVKFLNTGKNQQIGLIAMLIDDENSAEIIDQHISQIIVLFNSSNEAKSLTFKETKHFILHPDLADNDDPIVKQSRIYSTGFEVPPLTVSVFIKPRIKSTQ
ncbi:pullulanase-type alpha-1,6-glucosidase [Thalassotalea piscium]